MNPYQDFEPQPGSSYGTLSVFEMAQLPSAWPENLLKGAADLTYRSVAPQETPLLQTAMQAAGEYGPNEAAQRVKDGAIGYIGQDAAGTIAAYGWVTAERIPIGPTGLAFVPPADDVYLFDFATLLEFRGHGYYPTLLRYILQDLAAQGKQRAWIMTAPGNEVSARSIGRAGFQLVAQMEGQPNSDGQGLSTFKVHFSPDLSPTILQATRKLVEPV